MSKGKIVSIALFYLLAYLIAYIVNPLLFPHLEMPHPFPSLLLTHTLTLVEILLIAYLVLKLNNENCTLSTFGIRKDNLGNSFLWAAAFSTPIPLLWLIGTKIVGFETILIAAKPSWANPPISLQVLMSAILLWILAGIVAFMFWEAFPYELMKDFPQKLATPLIAVLWTGLYNTPLLTGKIDPFDAIFFGFLFTLTYHKARNSMGILMAYLLNENPLWWVTAAVFGSNIKMAFTVFLIFRMLICSISTFWVIKTKNSK